MLAQLWLHRLLMVFLLVIGITSSALAREASRVLDVPRDFPGWAALRADEASLAETAMGAPAGQFYHAADFCLGAMFDAGMSQGSVGGLPLPTSQPRSARSGSSMMANRKHAPAVTSKAPLQPQYKVISGPSSPASKSPAGTAVCLMENTKGACFGGE